MKSTVRFLLLLTAAGIAQPASAQIAEGQEMVTIPGDGRVHELTLNGQVVTTVTFPDAITMVTGYGMVLNAAAAQELIDSEKLTAVMSRDMEVKPVTIVHYAQASPDTLALRAVRRGTPCYLTVRCDASVYLFKLESGEAANLSVVVEAPGARDDLEPLEVKPGDVVKSRLAFSSAELVGILSKARSREFLQTVNPGLYTGWRERRGVSMESDNGPVTATVTEIQQWPAKDAIVLRAKLRNAGEKEFRYNPIDTKVRVGNRSYTVQLADGTGVAPANSTTLLDLVLQGNSTGGKEHLSIENEFYLEIAADTLPASPNALLPPPQPLTPTPEPGLLRETPVVIYEGGSSPGQVDPGDLPLPVESSAK